MEVVTFIAGWFLIAVGGAVGHYVMRKRIDAEIREEEQDEGWY